MLDVYVTLLHYIYMSEPLAGSVYLSLSPATVASLICIMSSSTRCISPCIFYLYCSTMQVTASNHSSKLVGSCMPQPTLYIVLSLSVWTLI